VFFNKANQVKKSVGSIKTRHTAESVENWQIPEVITVDSENQSTLKTLKSLESSNKIPIDMSTEDELQS